MILNFWMMTAADNHAEFLGDDYVEALLIII